VSRVLVLAGGSPHAHDFAASGAALVELFTDLGHTVRLVDDPDAAAALLGSPADVPDALVVDGLWWRMLGDAYDRWRDDHAYSPPAATRDALTSFVRNGGGLVAVHTTPICFDDWPEWGDVVGGSWRWGVSSHPPAGPVRARVVADHPVVDGLPTEIELCDEVYGDMAVGDVEVLAVAKRHGDDPDQPVVWIHRYGRGRVVFDGFGHDTASLRDTNHSRLLGQAIAWVSEAD
jgi:hypothetical protein